MISLQNISIRKRLMFILMMWVVIFIGFGGYALSKIHQLGSMTRFIYDHPLKVTNAAIEARVDLIKIQKTTKDLILSRNKDELQSEINEIALLDKAVLDNLDIIRNNATITDSINLEKHARVFFLEWKTAQEGIIRLVQEGDIEQATMLTKDIYPIKVDEIESTLIKIDENSRGKADELSRESQTIESKQREYLYATIFLLCLAFFTVFLVTIRSILWPIERLKEIMKESIQTGKLSLVYIEGNNEVSEMSRSYNGLANKLINMLWIKDKQNELNLVLSGYYTPEELVQKMIRKLCRLVNGGRGVLFLYDKSSNRLKLTATYAFEQKDILSKELSLGEGIIGQAALEKKAILLKGIKNEGAMISTALFSQPPVNTYVFPIIHEGELLGVAEIASLEAFDDVKLEYLEEVNGTIGINLYAAMQNAKIRELLHISEESEKEIRWKAEELEQSNKELHRQREILQIQSEELQQSNEELEEQQQILEQQSEEMQQTNMQLEEQHQQLEEQTRLLNEQNIKLNQAKLELEISNKYKSEFLANMSHELRTPLNSIILLAKLLLNKLKEDHNSEDYEKADVIYKAGQELLRLINDVLDLSKIESGRMNLEKFSFHSSNIANALKNMFEIPAREKGLQLQITDEVDHLLYGDEHKISQILRNLISNAMKFTESGTIEVSVRKNTICSKGVLFTVRDSGIGITEAQQKIIFEAFQQGDGSISRKYGGTGLGLSISKQLVELMGGSIRVVSRIGEGSEFILELPDLFHEEEDKDAVIVSAVREAAVTSSKQSGSYQQMESTILVIEDDSTFGEYIKDVIQGIGFKAVIAATGGTGIEYAKTLKPRGILLDLGLPDMNGIDVLRELKSIIELRDIPVHIISVSDKNNKPQRIGAVGYHQKPVEEEEIVRLVRRMVGIAEKSSKTILLIEDNKSQEEYVRNVVRDLKVELQVADTEDAAKDQLEKSDLDIIILDLDFCERKKLDLFHLIVQRNVNVPVIVYINGKMTLEQEKLVRKYADSVIVKTANSSERLLDEITLFLHKVKKNTEQPQHTILKTKDYHCLSLKGKSILIVDDDPRNIYTLAAVLEDFDASIVEANDGRCALQKLEEEKVDLILMDIMMPNMDGYEAISCIKKDSRWRSIPVIALTAKSLKADREKCIAVGADDYIPKPVDYDNLIRLIRAWIYKED